MDRFCTATGMAGLFLYFLVPPAVAQTDYRNLDNDRPVITEDAYPVERYAFELLAPYRYAAEADGARLHTAVPEVACWSGSLAIDRTFLRSSFLDEWRNMADHIGGVELMGGRATALVRSVQAPSTQLPADRGHSNHMDHDNARIDGPMKGLVHQGVRDVDSFTANLVKAPIGTPDTNSTTATGSATMSLVGGLLLYRVDVTGLRNGTVAHIHGPAAPGLSAPVIVDLCGTTQGPGGPPTTPPCVSGTGTLVSGVAPPVKNMSFDRLLVLLRNDSAYVNVHTTAHPGGEIRGTIVRP